MCRVCDDVWCSTVVCVRISRVNVSVWRARWDRIGEPRDSVLTCGSLVHDGGRSITDVLLKLPVKTLRAHSLGRRPVHKRSTVLRNIIHSRRTRQRAKRRHYDLAAADSVANSPTLPDLSRGERPVWPRLRLAAANYIDPCLG